MRLLARVRAAWLVVLVCLLLGQPLSAAVASAGQPPATASEVWRFTELSLTSDRP